MQVLPLGTFRSRPGKDPGQRHGISLGQYENAKDSVTPMHKKEQTGGCKCPPSILRRKPPEYSVTGDRKRAERRVRFQEPEGTAVHDDICMDTIVAPDRWSSGCSLFLCLCLCILLGLALSLYCGHTKLGSKALEEFRAWILFVLLRVRHMAVTFWKWFGRQ
ncbi:nutritionally-regulated adipose and cardiac enriched protein homolog isoform X1 [Dromiciops gliroides]|uniref:nutritionally-regulated adipose and cardiac enriched protein homolog isoform X1 n=1 Tax=Dromiciops gliroides TaxID=33562 RepID=UPI001CC693BB|nr:nutritionally-regulated adipose and cardiac enriched protein homolog isoform X1 [Dromiciops gliroides]